MSVVQKSTGKYLAERYEQLVQEGCTAKEARLQVARLLGHGRDSVTRIYLAKHSKNIEP